LNTLLRTLICLLLAGLMLLAACGKDKELRDPPPGIVITIQPQPDATVMAGCQTGELESWYEVTSSNLASFRQASQAGLNSSQVDAAGVFNRLLNLRDAIARQPTPECTVSVHGIIMQQITETLTAYQEYVNGELSQAGLRERVEAANRSIDTEIAGLLAGTQAGLEQQLAADRATQAAAPTAEP
jgi:hypothetical protein